MPRVTCTSPLLHFDLRRMLRVEQAFRRLFVARFYEHLLRFFDSIWRLIVDHVGLVSA